MGNLFTFNFDKNKNFKPKFSIGPNWYMTLSLNIVIIIFTIILYSLIIRKLNIIFGIIYITLSLFTIFCVSRTALIHTEIAMNKYPDSINNVYCNKCKVYYNGFEKVDFVSAPGQYSVRGSIIDIFSYSYNYLQYQY